MKKFKEKEYKKLETINGGINDTPGKVRISVDPSKDEWNCWQIEFDFEITHKIE